MLSKKVVKDIQSLGLRKRREESGLFVAEGPKVVNELLYAVPGYIQSVFATEAWKNTNAITEFTVVSEEELSRMSQLSTPNQVLAVVRRFPSTPPAAGVFTLYLDAIQDPGNFGTIIRIADWFGVRQLVCSRGCADLYNPKVVQSTMASIARVKVFYDVEENWLSRQGQTIYAAALDGEPLSSIKQTGNGILIIGNESKGIREEFLKMAGQRITIPKRGEAESLNAAVATGIILSHLMAES